jgi:hypothetical protein
VILLADAGKNGKDYKQVTAKNRFSMENRAKAQKNVAILEISHKV